MAIEKIIEFSKGNKFKVKLEVSNIDTSTVVDVEIEDKELEQRASDEFSFGDTLTSRLDHTTLSSMRHYLVGSVGVNIGLKS